MKSVELVITDPGHLEAHRKEFLIPLDDVLQEVRTAIAVRNPKPGCEDVFAWKTKKAVGTGGLAVVHAWTKGDWWAPRKGRTIPSHLIHKERRSRIRTLCIWGRWESKDRFLLHTVYPGKPAPREIHDPELNMNQMNESVRFWARHAIIVEN